MATVTKGFQGAIDDTAMSTHLLLLPPHVYGAGELVAAQTAGTRNVVVSAGTAWANFIKATFEATPLAFTPPASGGQWWAIVVTRQWSPTSTAIIEAIDTGVATDGTIPKIVPKGVYTGMTGAAFWRKNPGTAGNAPNGTHQVLALVHVRAADTTLTMFDTRLIRGAGALQAPTLAALVAMQNLGYLPNAALITVGLFASLLGQYHERSVWMVRSDGALMPHGRIILGGRNSGADAFEELRLLSVAGVLALQAGETAASNSYTAGDNYVWSGTDWVADPRNAFASQTVTGDANSLLSNGEFKGQDLANAPSAGWHWYSVRRYDDSYVLQTAVGFTDAPNREWRRIKQGGVWSAWKEQASLGSPAFTGAPTAPSPASNDSSSRIATTEWVQYNSGIRVYGITGLRDLMLGAGRPAAGSIIHVGYGTDFFTHYASVWRVTADGKAEPLNGVPILLPNLTALGNLESNYLYSGWQSWMNLDHRNSAAVVTSPTRSEVRLEYRWDSQSSYLGRTGFRLWPGPDTLFRLDYRGGTDQSLAGNAFTTMLYDTWDTNPLDAQYDGNGQVVMPARTEGRWEFRWKLAVTNDETSNLAFRLTCYNASRNIDEMTGYSGAYANRMMVCSGEHFLTAQNTLRTAFERSNSSINQWRRNGAAGSAVMPTWSMKMIGWS